jgi:hypothetical protein
MVTVESLRCGRSYGVWSWTSLELVLTLARADLQRHLSVPAEWRIEVRRCECGATLAARA